jgi:hypothetical protein
VNIRGGSSLYTNENIPQDLMGVRNSLSNFFMQHGLQMPTAYGGNLNTSMPGYGSDAARMAGRGVGTADEFGRLFGSGYGQVFGAGPQTQGQGMYGMANPNLQEMMQTGGMANLTPAMDAIRAQSMGQMEDMQAQLREQFGAMGLGAGSDVNEALARGTSRGIADMNAQMSNLQVGAWGQAQGNRMNALGMAPGYAQGMAQPYENSLNRNAGMLGMIPGMTSAASNPYFQGAGNLMQLAGLDMGSQEGNINRAYQEYLRQQSPQFLDQMAGYATGFPGQAAQKPVVQGGGNNWLGMLGMLGSAAIGLSDASQKEDIVPFQGSVLRALRELQISTWRYRGENTVHLGPMAQDMKRLFGVGDGKTIHVVDVMGILMAAAKEIADAQTA